MIILVQSHSSRIQKCRYLRKVSFSFFLKVMSDSLRFLKIEFLLGNITASRVVFSDG